MRTGASLRLENIGFAYERHLPVVEDFSLLVEPGEMVALLGASGCGKTTVLKLIAGLLHPAVGTISIDGAIVNGIAAEKRRAAMVFQKPLLFPYLLVGENVGFSLKLKGAAGREVGARVSEALALVRLDGFEARRSTQLSGGQEQRVALARALVSDPRILLLDEPFAALDENLRAETRALVRSLQRKLGLTSILVTHDKNEGAAMADRIVLIHNGRMEQSGPLREFYETPATIEAARFFGWQILAGMVRSGRLETALATLDTGAPDGPVWVAIRVDSLRFVTSGQGAVASVESSIDLGNRVSTSVTLPSGETLVVEHSLDKAAHNGTVMVAVRADSIRVFPRR